MLSLWSFFRAIISRKENRDIIKWISFALTSLDSKKKSSAVDRRYTRKKEKSFHFCSKSFFIWYICHKSVAQPAWLFCLELLSQNMCAASWREYYFFILVTYWFLTVKYKNGKKLHTIWYNFPRAQLIWNFNMKRY